MSNDPKHMKNPVFCGIDTPDLAHATDLATAIAPYVGGLKLGLEFFNAQGRAGLEAMASHGLPIFADLKFHDIPNTVAGAVNSVLPAKPAVLNVHASGGPAMMEAAVRAAEQAGKDKPLMIAVTVLTSLDETDLARVGMRGSPADQVVRLAKLAKECGMDGVVCSSHEIEILKAELGADFKLIVPGIRPKGSAIGDQKRVMTPTQALRAGADYLVIARPIIAANDPADAAQQIAREIAAGDE